MKGNLAGRHTELWSHNGSAAESIEWRLRFSLFKIEDFGYTALGRGFETRNPKQHIPFLDFMSSGAAAVKAMRLARDKTWKMCMLRSGGEDLIRGGQLLLDDVVFV